MEENYIVVQPFSKKTFLIQKRENNVLYILKKIPKYHKTEIELLPLIHHPNIIQYIEHFPKEEEGNLKEVDLEGNKGNDEKQQNDQMDQGNVEIVMEYAIKGDLKKILSERKLILKQMKRKKNVEGVNALSEEPNGAVEETSESYECPPVFFSEDEALLYFCPIVKALQYLHENNVFHKDIKAEHIFITWDNTVKVSDWSMRGGDKLLQAKSKKEYETDLGNQSVRKDSMFMEKREEKEEDSIATSAPKSERGEGEEARSLNSTQVKVEEINGLPIISMKNKMGQSENNSPVKGTIDVLPPAHQFADTVRGVNSFAEFNAEEKAQIYDDNDPKNSLGDVWALGCLLYEILTLEAPFQGATLLEYMNNFLRGDYKSINANNSDHEKRQLSPQMRGPSYSQNVEDLISCMLDPDPEHRITEKEILALPFLQPYFSWLEEREQLIAKINQEREIVKEQAFASFETEIHDEEDKEFTFLAKEHQRITQLLRLKEYCVSLVFPAREREKEEKKEEKMRFLVHSTVELERDLIVRYEEQWRELLYSEYMLECTWDQIHLSQTEAKERFWIEEADYEKSFKKLRQARATDRLVVELTSTARYPYSKRLPPIQGDVENSVESMEKYLKKLIIDDNANILYQGPEMQRPILHEFLLRGNVEAVRICLSTNPSIDFTVKDDEGKTPLHWVFCYGKTATLLNVVLDRLDRRGPKRRKTCHTDADVTPSGAVVSVTPEGVSCAAGSPQPIVEPQDDFLPDVVDWSLTDNDGNDFISLAAYFGHVALVWNIVKERKVRYFRKYKGPIPINRKVRLADWEQLTHRERDKKFAPVRGVEE